MQATAPYTPRSKHALAISAFFAKMAWAVMPFKEEPTIYTKTKLRLKQ